MDIKVSEIVNALKELSPRVLWRLTASGVLLLLAWNVDGLALLVQAIKQ